MSAPSLLAYERPCSDRDILWTYNTVSPRKLSVEYNEKRKYEFARYKHCIEETRRDKTYIWYKWKEGMVPVHYVAGATSVPVGASLKDYMEEKTARPEIDFSKVEKRLLEVPVPMTLPEGSFSPWHPPRKLKPQAWPEQLETCVQAGLSRLLLVGPPGTGKTTAAATGHKFSVTCHEAMGPETMIGMFILKAGETVWIDGPATEAMRTGQRLILNEIDRTSGECTSLLYALMDDKPAIMLPTGEYVTAVPGYNVVGTSNANPNDIPDAILDRIEAVMLAVAPHEGAVGAIANLAPADISKQVVYALQNYYKSLTNSHYAWQAKPTVRRMFSFSKLLNHGVNDKIAAELVFGKSGQEIISCLQTAAK